MHYQLSIVVPTLNEVGNIDLLYNKISIALTDINWEIIFVDDDSTDGTKELLKQLSSQKENVQTIYRINKKGLSSACIEGMHICKAPIIAVMDADLQHDEKLLPKMFSEFLQPSLDIVIASRFLQGSDLGKFTAKRELLSNTGNKLSRLFINANLSDPLSGFFMLRSTLIKEINHNLYGKGFKILLDIFISSKRKLIFKELPLKFNSRHSGESKLDMTIAFEFIGLLCHKFFVK